VFAAHGQPLTRYGIYKVIRRHASRFDDPRTGRQVSPHTFRHTAAVHLLEAGVEVNMIRGWLGHADLATTNRYAEINTKTKLAALHAAEPHHVPAGSRTNLIWRSDQSLLKLACLAVIIMWPAAAAPSRSPVTRTASHITRPGTELGLCSAEHNPSTTPAARPAAGGQR
jgi:hypothetical protein